MTELTGRHIALAITNGELDLIEVKKIKRAIEQLEESMQQSVLGQLTKGTTVVFNDKCNPKYMIGMTGTITKVNRKTVMVQIKVGAGRFRTGTEVKCPVALLDIHQS